MIRDHTAWKTTCMRYPVGEAMLSLESDAMEGVGQFPLGARYWSQETARSTFEAPACNLHSHAVLAVLDALDDAIVHEGQA